MLRRNFAVVGPGPPHPHPDEMREVLRDRLQANLPVAWQKAVYRINGCVVVYHMSYVAN